MKVSREQVEENRRKITDVAGRLLRERGFAAVSVADVMKAAGLTHGAFYGYFTSKDDLIAHAVKHALQHAARWTQVDLAAYAAGYLSTAHRDNVGEGCPTAALAAEAARSNPEARSALTNSLRHQLEVFAKQLSGTAAEKRRTAIGVCSAMVGAIVLARLCDDPELSDELLKQTRGFIRDQLKAK